MGKLDLCTSWPEVWFQKGQSQLSYLRLMGYSTVEGVEAQQYKKTRQKLNINIVYNVFVINILKFITILFYKQIKCHHQIKKKRKKEKKKKWGLPTEQTKKDKKKK